MKDKSKARKAIIDTVIELQELFPSQRFYQLLFNYGMLGIGHNPDNCTVADPFYYQDEDVLKTLKKNIKKLHA